MSDAHTSSTPTVAGAIWTELSRLEREVRSARTHVDARVTSLGLDLANRIFRIERTLDEIVADQRRLDHRLDLLERELLPSRVERVEYALGINRPIEQGR